MNKICWEFITEFSTILYRIYFWSNLICEIYIFKFKIKISFQGDLTVPWTWKIFYKAVILLCSKGLFTANVIYRQLQTLCTISTFQVKMIPQSIVFVANLFWFEWLFVEYQNRKLYFLKTNIIMSESYWGTIDV